MGLAILLRLQSSQESLPTRNGCSESIRNLPFPAVTPKVVFGAKKFWDKGKWTRPFPGTNRCQSVTRFPSASVASILPPRYMQSQALSKRCRSMSEVSGGSAAVCHPHPLRPSPRSRCLSEKLGRRSSLCSQLRRLFSLLQSGAACRGTFEVLSRNPQTFSLGVSFEIWFPGFRGSLEGQDFYSLNSAVREVLSCEVTWCNFWRTSREVRKFWEVRGVSRSSGG